MDKNKPAALPRKGRTPHKSMNLNIPLDLYNQMVEGAGLKKGEVTPFIIKAIEEKLDREKPAK